MQVDSNGNAYVGGILGSHSNYQVAASLPALSSLPTACPLPDLTNGKAAYVSQVDPSGNVLASQYIGGSALGITGVALAGTASTGFTLWIAGAANLINFPFSPNALTGLDLSAQSLPGAYLGAVNFLPTQPSGTPQVGCLVDTANLEPAGPIVPNQLVTIFGSGLGPTTPVTATDSSTTSLGGVTVTFGSLPATLLYVSANQINLAVPLVPEGPALTTMQVTVNGVPSQPLAFPVVSANPTLFAVPGSYNTTVQEFEALAINADGSVNSAANPAQLGSAISVFVNGLAIDPLVSYDPPLFYTGGGWALLNYKPINTYVMQVNLQAPTSTANMPCQGTLCTATVGITDLFSSSVPPVNIAFLELFGYVYIAQ